MTRSPERWLIAVLSIAFALAAHADDIPTRLPAARRIVAMGDWHGDLDAARASLRLSGVIDAEDHWIGGRTVVVQTGDQLDRGDQEQAVLELIDRLAREAAAAGGAVHALLGNHELMNVAWDFRYVTDAGWEDFRDAGVAFDPADTALARFPPEHRARAAAFRPGGTYARLMAGRRVVLVIGRTLFVHGGILPHHLQYGIDRLNADTRAWLRGESAQPSIFMEDDDPVWSRDYNDAPDAGDCAVLAQVLEELDCDRIVMGHTVQEDGIAGFCDDRAWCVDTGAAAVYGGRVEVLEITPRGVTILR